MSTQTHSYTHIHTHVQVNSKSMVLLSHMHKELFPPHLSWFSTDAWTVENINKGLVELEPEPSVLLDDLVPRGPKCFASSQSHFLI